MRIPPAPTRVPPPLQTAMVEESRYITNPWAMFFQSLSGGRFLVDTHANRLSDYNAEEYSAGSVFYESDRGAYYIVGPNAATKLTGAVTNVATSIAVASATNIAPMSLLAIEAEIVRVDAVAGLTLTVTRGIAGTVAAAHAAGATVRRKPAWRYFHGTMRDTFANAPADLATDDVGFLFFVTTGTAGVEYYHLARWTGSAWEAAEGERWGGYFSYFLRPPIEKGWQSVNGATTKYLDITAGALAEAAITLPNETAGVYRKTAAAYTGVVAAAVPAGITGSTATEGSHTHGAGTLATGAPSAATNVTAGGVAVASSTHTHTLSGSTAAGSAHSHGVGTLANDGTAEPAHLDVLPYFRR